jgi:hypothetical protein
MLDFISKIDGDQTDAGIVRASEYNSIFNENKNVITPFIALNGEENNQLLKSIDIMTKSNYYKDTGTVNNILLSRSSTITESETFFDDMILTFTPKVENTGATTIKIKTLATKSVFLNGIALVAGDLKTDEIYTIKYSVSLSRFDIIASISNRKEIIVESNLFVKPNKRVPLFTKVNPSTIRIPSGFVVAVGANRISLDANYDLSLNTDLVIPEIKTEGKDYYVYAKTDGSFYLSSNDALTDKIIGGFHYGLTTETEVISGNKTESDMVKLRGINSYTFWDLKYISNAKKGNKGMFCNGVKWYDIYLNDIEYGINGYSRPFAQIAGGGTEFGRGYPKIPLEFGGNGTVTYGKLTPFQAYDLAISSKKDLISYKEFTDIAYGVQEGLSQAEPVLGQNGHVPALTSRYGMELATGNQYIWSSEIGNSTATGWSSIADSRGQVYTNAYIALLGGGRVYAAGISGSRCSFWDDTLSYSFWAYGSRCCSDLLILD